MKRPRNRAVRTKEGKETERKRKMSFQLVVRYGEMLFVKSRFLACIPSPRCSPHYNLGGVYIGWIKMGDVDGAIELTIVDEFI